MVYSLTPQDTGRPKMKGKWGDCNEKWHAIPIWLAFFAGITKMNVKFIGKPPQSGKKSLYRLEEEYV